VTIPGGAHPEYNRVVAEITSTSPSITGKLFGMPCLKNDIGKAFAGYYQGSMVFKLAGADHARAIALPGAHLFDPSGRGRPMKEWVVVPPDHAALWLRMARQALRYSESEVGD